MKSVFIGADKLVLNNAYSRKDAGYKNTQSALMKINAHERIAFFNLGAKYDNRLTKKGFILEPRYDLNNDSLIDELTSCTTYLFLRRGIIGPYYYLGIIANVNRLDKNHILCNLEVKEISDDIVKKLGDFQPLP